VSVDRGLNVAANAGFARLQCCGVVGGHNRSP
jgi:hypothetical protein